MLVEALGLFDLQPCAQEGAGEGTHQIQVGDIDRPSGFGEQQPVLVHMRHGYASPLSRRVSASSHLPQASSLSAPQPMHCTRQSGVMALL